MSKYHKNHVFTSESVSEGHPDKVADQISDAILDACLAKDPHAHVAAETAVGPNVILNLGEITGKDFESISTESIARAIVRDIGYDRPAEGFCYDTFVYLNHIHPQSQDINQGVDRGSIENQGAGDQGMMFGYASNATPELMPAPILLSHKLLRHFAKLRKTGVLPYLRPDAKAQVSVLHEGGQPVRITAVVLSHQTEDIDIEIIRRDILEQIHFVLDPTGLLSNDTQFHINPTDKFVKGGPESDAGVTGRKIIVDTYGGVGAHGGGAFSGKDPSKVDRSAAYYARYAAKNIVKAGLADKCEIQVSYAIGLPEPMSVNVATFGTAKIPEERIQAILENRRIFDFRPGILIQKLGLLEPKGWCYRDTAAYGHFGRPEFPWERTDLVEAIRSEAGL